MAKNDNAHLLRMVESLRQNIGENRANEFEEKYPLSKSADIEKKKDGSCNAKNCAPQRGLTECKECSEFPCIKATSADYRSMIHTEVHYADEITWGILPYVPWQYER